MIDMKQVKRSERTQNSTREGKSESDTPNKDDKSNENNAHKNDDSNKNEVDLEESKIGNDSHVTETIETRSKSSDTVNFSRHVPKASSSTDLSTPQASSCSFFFLFLFYFSLLI